MRFNSELQFGLISSFFFFCILKCESTRTGELLERFIATRQKKWHAAYTWHEIEGVVSVKIDLLTWLSVVSAESNGVTWEFCSSYDSLVSRGASRPSIVDFKGERGR